MGVEEIDYRDKETDCTPKCPVILAAFANTEIMDDELRDNDSECSGDSVYKWEECLTCRGPTVIEPNPIPSPFAEAVNMVLAMEDLPSAVILSCGGGGHTSCHGRRRNSRRQDSDVRRLESSRVHPGEREPGHHAGTRRSGGKQV